MPTITVLLASDSLLIGDGLSALFTTVAGVKVVGRVRSYLQLLDTVDQLRPDAVIISIRTLLATTLDTIEIARRLRAEHERLGVVVISDRGNGFAVELLRGGTSRLAYLLDERLPTLDAVVDALRAVCQGQTVLDSSVADAMVRRYDGTGIEYLAAREIAVLEQIACGLSNPAIAAELHVSVKTIEKHISIIFRKLGLGSGTLIDRRVTAALVYLRAEVRPFILYGQSVDQN